MIHFIFTWFFPRVIYFDTSFLPHESFICSCDSFCIWFFFTWFSSVHKWFFLKNFLPHKINLFPHVNLFFIWFLSFHMWFFPRDSFPFKWLIYFCMWFFSHDSFNSLCDSFHLIRSFPHMILFMWFISFPLVNFSTWLLLLLLFFFTSHSFTRLIYFSFYISILFTQMILSHGSFLLTFNHILLTKVKWVWFYFIEAGLSIILLIHGASCVRNSVSLRQELNS